MLTVVVASRPFIIQKKLASINCLNYTITHSFWDVDIHSLLFLIGNIYIHSLLIWHVMIFVLSEYKKRERVLKSSVSKIKERLVTYYFNSVLMA